ncbi:MAG: nuclear transport factor 2 family protein [Acidobacteria bacterium]|nr:nuclear transport factor 2 family protein [Acidobacteriota bacterium]
MRLARLTFVVVVLMLAASGATWMLAQQQRASDMLSPEDYLEILQMYYLYAHDVDPGSEHDASWMFAEDGSFSSGGDPVVGRAALKEFYEGVRNRHSAGIRHVNASVVIMPTEEGARGMGYMLQVEQRQEDGPIEITLFGKYTDRWVQTSEGWRIKERRFVADTWRGDTSNQ